MSIKPPIAKPTRPGYRAANISFRRGVECCYGCRWGANSYDIEKVLCIVDADDVITIKRTNICDRFRWC